MWLLDLMIGHPRTKTRIHISEKCVNFIGACITTRSDKIEMAGLSVKVRMVINDFHFILNVKLLCIIN